jgi:hypothetical protein
MVTRQGESAGAHSTGGDVTEQGQAGSLVFGGASPTRSFALAAPGLPGFTPQKSIYLSTYDQNPTNDLPHCEMRRAVGACSVVNGDWHGPSDWSEQRSDPDVPARGPGQKHRNNLNP